MREVQCSRCPLNLPEDLANEVNYDGDFVNGRNDCRGRGCKKCGITGPCNVEYCIDCLAMVNAANQLRNAKKRLTTTFNIQGSVVEAIDNAIKLLS